MSSFRETTAVGGRHCGNNELCYEADLLWMTDIDVMLLHFM